MLIVTKLKVGFTILSIIVVIYFVSSIEFVQKLLYDKKADYLGADRTITFYAKMTGDEVASFSDKDTRIDLEAHGEISVWLGEAKRKIVSNMDYIIFDNVKVKK